VKIAYRYCQPAPDEHGRTVFSLAIDGPEHPFVRVVEEWIEVPDGAGPHQVLERIYARNQSEITPLRPRRLEISSMFTGCLVQLAGGGWWLCDRFGFEPASFKPVVLEGKTLYRDALVDDFPRSVVVATPALAYGFTTADGVMILTRRGVSDTLAGTVGGTTFSVRPAAPQDGWEVDTGRLGRTSPAPSLRAALDLAARFGSAALGSPLAPAPVIGTYMYTGARARRMADDVPERIVCPLYYDPAGDAVRAVADDQVVLSFRGTFREFDEAAHPAADHAGAAARVGIHCSDITEGDHHCKRRIAWLGGRLWMAASVNPLTCGLLSDDMVPHPVLTGENLFQ
jgi:hypothetical protein